MPPTIIYWYYMETYNKASIIKKLQDSGYILITVRLLREMTGITSPATLYRLINNLVKSEILGKLERGKYYVNNHSINDLTKANIFYSPSYISFESALNIHGILSQLAYEITSATLKKTKSKKVDNVLYTYTHLKKSLYWGYYKNGDILIAEPEKALLDQLYLHSKGFKGQSIDEYDLARLNLSKLWQYTKKFPQTAKFKIQIKKLKDELKNPHHYDVI